jgi:hypothetical protein
MHIIPHNLLSYNLLWAHPCDIETPTGEEQVAQEEDYYEEFEQV